MSQSNVVPFPRVFRPTSAPVEGIRERDPEAIAAVYRTHHNKVRAFARRMLNDASAAEDVVHDVFVALPDAIVGFRGDASLSTFLIGIAVNVCRRRLRSKRRGDRAVATMVARDVTPYVRTPEAEARGRQLADALTRAMTTLSVEHREVIVLCAIQQQSSRQAAESLGVPEGTVRTRLMAARKNLRRRLQEEGVE